MYADLSGAILEVLNHINVLPDVSALIIKTDWDKEMPYLPVYVLHMGKHFVEDFKDIQKSSTGKVVAIFATVR